MKKYSKQFFRGLSGGITRVSKSQKKAERKLESNRKAAGKRRK